MTDRKGLTFSIAAINDSSSPQPRLETLQPTKEAQEARLAQTYQEALTELQAGNLLKAQTLLQSILQDPIILQAKTTKKENGSESIDSNPMLQLRFSTLKNLAETLYKQDSKYHYDALNCYLQAVAIDQDDVVLWNRLGTLACALGHLNIARAAFEQGLLCSPRNWLCMEKIAEVLIAIGDEEACRFIVKSLLKISPSHSRAIFIDNVLEGRADAREILTKRGYFNNSLFKLNVLPRGLDLLEPQHASLSFPKKRQLEDESKDQGGSKRKKVQSLEVIVPDLSWGATLTSVLDQLQDSVGRRGANTSVAVPQDNENTGNADCNSIDTPQVNKLVALVPNMTPKSTKESVAEEGPALSTKRLPIPEEWTSSASLLNGIISIDEECNTSSKVVPIGGLTTFTSPTHSSLKGEQSMKETRLEDIISSDLGQAKQQIIVESSGPYKVGVALFDDELPSLERRSTRLERIRTRRYDKDEEVFLDKDKDENQCEILRRLLEPFISGSSQDVDPLQLDRRENVYRTFKTISRGGPADAGTILEDLDIQEGSLIDEEIKVQQFIEELKVNGGPYHVAHELLEKLSAVCCRHRIPISKVLMLENITRQFSWTTRSRECSMFLAELCLDMFTSCSHRDSTLYLTECDFHLCRVVEHAVLHADFTVPEADVARMELNIAASAPTTKFTSDKGGSMKNIRKKSDMHKRDTVELSGGCPVDVSPKLGQPVSGSSAKTPNSQHMIEMVRKSREDDWSLWVRYHWLNGRWQMCSGRQEEAYQELKLCLAILESRAQLVDKSTCVLLPHCKTIITPLTVQRKLYELQIDKLLKHSAAHMVEQAQYGELIDLLVPVLFPDNDLDRVKLGYDETKRLVVDSSPEYIGLNMLISACEKVTPPNLRLALQCHARKLEILLSAVSSVNSSRRVDLLDSLELDRSPLMSEPAQEQEQGMDNNEVECNLVAEEVKLISSCVSCIGEQLAESGDMVSCSVQPSLLQKTQHLLLNCMCHYIKILELGRSANFMDHSFNLQFDSSSFVNACIAFCGLQHLDANCTLEQQVSLLATVHDVLAEHGLCCAGKVCEGGEGAFLKLAIKHLGTVELRLRLTTGHPECLELPQSGVNGAVMGIDEKDERERSPEQLFENKDDVTEERFASKTGKGKRKKSLKTVKDEETEEIERRRVQLGLDSVLDQCFFCLYGLNLRGGVETSSQSDGLTEHKNTNRGDYRTKEQCAGVYQYVLPYAKACSRAQLLKLRKVLRAVHKQFPNPPRDILAVKAVDSFLDDPEFDEEKLSEMVLSSRSLSEIVEYALKAHTSVCKQQETLNFNLVNKVIDPQSKQLETSNGILSQNGDSGGSGSNSRTSFPSIFPEMSGRRNSSVSQSDVCAGHGEPYLEVYENLYHFVSEIEDTSASDKWAGFVLTKEGEEFVEQNAKLLKYDLCYNPLRFESWYKLAKIYDEEVDLMLNDGSKNINAVDWRRNSQLTGRVEMSRRRTRRCLLMTLALSDTPEKQSEMHELLALVLYDSLQNVAPSYDQRRHGPARDTAWISLCQKALKHFERAFTQKPDWTHLFYMGKLCEKLCRPSVEVFDFYKRAVDMNSAAVDPVYRLHASRFKLLCRSDEHDVKILQVIAQYCFTSSIKEKVCSLLECLLKKGPDVQVAPDPAEPVNNNDVITEIRRHLFEDCVAVMKVCVEGELKHYHKARFRLAHALYTSTECQDMDRAKEELAFCFRSSRSLFTINMWEIDGSLRKVRRKAAHQTNLDVQMLESSRKFITCVRKYLVLYLSLCEKTGDIYTLERAFSSLKTDKKFSLCLDDLSRVALGKYIQALAMAICQAEGNDTISHSTLYSLLEKLFNLFMDYGTSWSESLQISLAEAQILTTNEVSENSIYEYIHRYLTLLENEVKLDTMEAINERIRKRFKSYKMVSLRTSQICRHACLAWGRALCYALASITPLPQSRHSNQSQTEATSSAEQVARLVVDLQEEIFMTSTYELPALQEGSRDNSTSVPSQRRMSADIESDSASLISCIKAVVVRQATSENLERATALLRSTYVFYRDSLSGPFPGGINLFVLGAVAVGEGTSNGVLSRTASGSEALDVSTPRKLLLWAFALVHGRTGSVSEAVKYCEEQAKVIPHL